MATNFHTSRLVEFSDTDMAGIMHFSAYFRYMEAAEHELLRSIGLSVYAEVEGAAISFPRVAASCQYKAPVRCENVLDIDVFVKRVGTKSVTYVFHFAHDGREVATGEMTSVCCRVVHGQPPEPMPIPDAFAEKLRRLAGT
jgi:4-hydroxybenzoyl-CoA thioesterase/acyl-CoA thioester hydrolase